MKSQFFKILLQILSIFIFCCSTILNSQSNGNNDFWKDVQFGGGISLGFGNQSFNLGVSPSGIYQVNSDFATGLSLNFNYSKFGDDKLLAYGPSFINFYNPLPYLQLSGEFEQWRINIDQNFNSISIEDNYWYSALFFGIGYTQQNFTIGIRYDVLFDETRSLYADPWIPFVRFYF